VIEDKFVEAEQDLNPSTLANKKHQWQKLVQGECKKSKVVGAVRQVKESDDFVDYDNAELDDLFDDVIDEAEVIAAVRVERGGGHRTRKFEQKPGKFKNLRKTFAGPNNAGGNPRGLNQQQVAEASKFKVFADVCRECHNDRSMTRKELHSFPMCPNKKTSAYGNGQGKKRAWPKRKVNAVTDEPDVYNDLTENDRRSIRSYAESQRGACLPH
jgi:hypothetical protein